MYCKIITSCQEWHKGMSSTAQKKPMVTKDKNGPKLPWWVELLFVQIGLPDQWLLPILKKRNKSIQSLVENKRKVLYTFLIILGFIYIQPYTSYMKRNTSCYLDTLSQLKSNDLDETFTKERLKSKATNYCNGGDSDLIF